MGKLNKIDPQVFWKHFHSRKVEFTTPTIDEWPVWVLERFNQNKNGKYLDFGAGYGRISKELLALGFKDLTLIDISPYLINKARQDLNRFVKNNFYKLDFIVGSEDDIPQVYFDGIFICGVIEYYVSRKERERLVSSLYRRLRRGGYLYLETFILDRLRSGEYYAKSVEKGFPYGTILLDNGLFAFHDSSDGIKSLFTKQGFKLLNENKRDFLTWTGRKVDGLQIMFEK